MNPRLDRAILHFTLNNQAFIPLSKYIMYKENDLKGSKGCTFWSGREYVIMMEDFDDIEVEAVLGHEHLHILLGHTQIELTYKKEISDLAKKGLRQLCTNLEVNSHLFDLPRQHLFHGVG